MKKYIDNSRGMVSIESLIVFPLLLTIIMIFSSYMLLEFEKSNIIISSNQMSLDILSFEKESLKSNKYIKVDRKESPFTRSVDMEGEIRFTSEILPEWASIHIKYSNKSSLSKKFNTLILKDALFDGFVSESEGDKE